MATDFSEDALRKARLGLHSQFDVQRGLPVSKLVKYFQKAGNGWQVKPALRERVVFREHNLLNESEDLGTFDIIFCRNVLIYFDEQLKRAVLGRLSRQLAADGYLVLGAAETTTGASPDFMPVPEGHHGIFCLTPEAIAARRQVKESRDGALKTGTGPGAAARLSGLEGVRAIGSPLERWPVTAPVKDQKSAGSSSIGQPSRCSRRGPERAG